MVLALDGDRALRALPAHHDEMLLSCGMYWHLLTRALAALGWQVSRLTCPPSAELAALPARWRPLATATFQPAAVEERCFDQLAELADRRRTNRGAYLPESIDRELALIARGAAEPLVSYWTDQPSRRLVAAMMAGDGTRDFTHAAAWQETYSYLRGTDGAARKRGDGFSVSQLLGSKPRVPSQLVRAALSPTSMRALSTFGFHRLIAQRMAASIASAPAILAISTRSAPDDLASWLQSGQEVMRAWLAATTSGIALHPVSVLIQHRDLRARLEDQLGVTGRLVFLARAGRPVRPASSSPRLSLAGRLRTI